MSIRWLTPLLFAALLTQCETPPPSVVVWVEQGSGRDVLRFGVGTIRGIRSPISLQRVTVRACAPTGNSSLDRNHIVWQTVADGAANAVDSTFVYGYAPAGNITQHTAETLQRGCYAIDAYSATDSSRECFLVSNTSEIEAVDVTSPMCLRH